LRQSVIDDPAVRKAMDKFTIIYSKDLDRLCEIEDDYQHSAELSVLTNAGESLTELVKAPTGLPIRPMTNDQLDNKFITCTTPQHNRDAMQNLLLKLKSISQLESIRQLFHDVDK
jgi:2-methylcitrate dehydratase PrpD